MKKGFKFEVVERVDNIEAPKRGSGVGIVFAIAGTGAGYAILVSALMT